MSKIINNKNDIYIELSLFVNKLMFDDKIINYDLYKEVQDCILKKCYKKGL